MLSGITKNPKIPAIIVPQNIDPKERMKALMKLGCGVVFSLIHQECSLIIKFSEAC